MAKRIWALLFVGAACLAGVHAASHDDVEGDQQHGEAAAAQEPGRGLKTRFGVGTIALCTIGCVAGSAVCCVPVVGPAAYIAGSTAIIGIVTGAAATWHLRTASAGDQTDIVGSGCNFTDVCASQTNNGSVTVDVGTPYRLAFERAVQGNATLGFNMSDPERKAAVLDVIAAMKPWYSAAVGDDDAAEDRVENPVPDVLSDAKWAFLSTAVKAMDRVTPQNTSEGLASIDVVVLIREFLQGPASAFLEWETSPADQLDLFLAWVANDGYRRGGRPAVCVSP